MHDIAGFWFVNQDSSFDIQDTNLAYFILTDGEFQQFQ